LEEVFNLASSDESDLIADFFCGSGTTLAVAEKLGRRWIGVDLGRQDFRTRKDRSLKTKTDIGWEYKTSGKKKIYVKVIDMFGVDTTTVVEVKV
jgi:DNA modification methylase